MQSYEIYLCPIFVEFARKIRVNCYEQILLVEYLLVEFTRFFYEKSFHRIGSCSGFRWFMFSHLIIILASYTDLLDQALSSLLV